ncbi:MAG: NfeD-like protein [Leptolyngbyaceae cyanobacterium MO_188.B28]|nr:NfeD-like protein [Leptolyngbyaceae cyanobacterium MO_188.B28]
MGQAVDGISKSEIFRTVSDAMLSIYWFSFLLGGIFVALAALSGFDGVDFDTEADIDVELIDQNEAPKGAAQNRTKRKRRRLMVGPSLLKMVKTLKFWTFGSCFFGLTGLLLSFLQPTLSTLGIAIIAFGVGLLCGTSMSGILVFLQRRQADSLVRSADLVGLIGTVEVPFDSTRQGKVRLKLKGSMVDFIAFTNDSQGFGQGDPVWVVGTEKNRLWVVSTETLDPSSSP